MKKLKRLMCIFIAAVLICPAYGIQPVMAEDEYLVHVTEGFNGYKNANGTSETPDPLDPENSVGRFYGVNTSMKWYNPRAYFADDGTSPKVFSCRAMITQADGSYYDFRLRGSANTPLVQLNANQTVSLIGSAAENLKWVTNKWINMYVYIDYSAIDTSAESTNYICPVYIYLSSDGGLVDEENNPVYFYTDTAKTIDMSGYAADFDASEAKNSINASGVIAANSECKIYLDDTFAYIPAVLVPYYETNEDGDYSREITIRFPHAVDMSTVSKSTISVSSAGGNPVEIESVECEYGNSDRFTVKFANQITATGRYVVDLSNVRDITGSEVENLEFTVEGVTYLPIESISISTEDILDQIYGYTFPVHLKAETMPVDGIREKNIEWYVNDVIQNDVSGLDFTCNFNDIGEYSVYAKDTETGVKSNTVTVSVKAEQDDVADGERFGMDITGGENQDIIPPDWKLLAQDNFDIEGEENIPLSEYSGGTGFASVWSADLACTDNSEEAFVSGQYSGKTYSNPYIEKDGNNSYLARHIGNSSNMAQAEYRRLAQPINMNTDAEYYVMFDMLFSSSSNVGTAQRMAFMDSGNANNIITAGSHAEMYTGKMTATVKNGDWGIGDPRKPVVTQPSLLSPSTGLYTMVLHISAREEGRDTVRYRVFFNEEDEEAATFFPDYWTTEYSAEMTYNNLDTIRFSCGNGTGTGYKAMLDNVAIYQASPVVITSDKPSEQTLVAGRTLSASVGGLNPFNHAQKLSYIAWYDYTNPNAVGQPLSASSSFTIPENMTGRRLLCLVTVKDLVTGDLTTYAPVNKFVRSELDLQQAFISTGDCKGSVNLENLVGASETYIRFDVTRNSSELTEGVVKVGVKQYSELGQLKKVHSAPAVKVSSLSSGQTSRQTVTLTFDNSCTVAPGDEFYLLARYIPGSPEDSDDLLDSQEGYLLDFAPEVTDTEHLNTKYVVPGGTQIKFEETWRSSLYPTDWQPGYTDEKGRGLQDFSYAGYHRGEKDIPSFAVTGENVYNVLDYGADPSGDTDSTAAIQAAIDDAGSSGGGVVYMPQGTFTITYQDGADYSLRMDKSGVVLKGAGAGKTFLYLNETYNRQKNAIYMGGGNILYTADGGETLLTRDITDPTKDIYVESTDGFEVGDIVCIGSNKRVTQEFCDEHYMSSWYNEDGTGKLDSVIFCREIMDIDRENNIIYIDIPTRYYILMRDGAKIFKPKPRTTEQGIEDFSISTRENTKDGIGENDYNKQDTCAYETYCSNFILARGVMDGWIRNISTYQGRDNSKYGSHIASNVICIHQSTRMTIENVHCSNTRYQGGGGNGYAFDIQGADCLFKDCSTYNVRHGYSFKSMQTTGNVIYNCSSENNKYVDDFHQHLSTANLIDNHYFMEGDRPRFEATNNGTYGSVPHGYTTSESTFWNCETTVVSKQVGMGYAIGCHAVDYTVGPTDNSMPMDFVEGTGKGSSLMPQSLYMDQKNRRLSENNVVVNQLYFSDENNSNQNEVGLSPILTKVKARISYNEALPAPTLCAAVYQQTEEGAAKLISVQMALNGEDYIYETDYFDLTGVDTENCYVKLFVVDNMDNIQPLMEKPLYFDSEGFRD